MPAIPFLIVLLITGIFLTEVIAMLALEAIHPILYQTMVLLDATIMVVLILPMVYFLTVRPLIANIQAKEKLRLSNDELELHVQERTAALRRVNAELKEVAQEYAALFNTTSDGVWIQNTQGEILEVNRAYCRMSGYTREELMHLPVHSLEAADAPQAIADHLRQGLDHGSHDSFESLHRRKDGSTFHVDITAFYIQKDIGRIAVFIRDITQRKQAEKALQRERDLLQAVMNGARNSHLVYLDRDFNFLCVNDTYARTCGYRPDEMIGKNHFDLYPHPENEAIFARVVQTAEPVEYRDKPFIFPDQPERGVTYWDWTLTPVKDGAGSVEGLIFSLYETTQRKMTEMALRASEERLRLATNAAGLFGWEVDINQNIFKWFENISPQQGIPLPDTLDELWDLIHPDDLPGMQKSIEQALANHKEFKVEFRLAHRAPGEEMWASTVGVAVGREGDALARVVGVTQDITGPKRVEKILTEARDELERRVQERTGELLDEINERKHIETALELERARLKNILDTMPEGVYIVSQNYEVEYANPVIEREFGPIDGQKCYAYFHALQEPCPWCMNERVFAGMPFAGERTYARNNKTYEIFDAPLVNLDKSVSKLKILHDITQRKNMELALKRSNRELQIASNAERQHRQFAEALVTAALNLNKSQHLDEVLKIILEQIKNVIHYQFANIGFLDGESFYEASRQGEASLAASNSGILKRYRLENFPLLKKMRQEVQPVLVPDTALEPRWQVVENFDWCRSFLSAPLIVEGNMIGFVNLFAGQAAFFTQAMCDRLAAFATHAAAAIQNAMLFEQVQASSERLHSLSRRLVEVQEAERLSISRELHDEAGQMLTSLTLDLRLLEKSVSHPEALLKKIGEMGGTLNAVQENLHNVAMALRPASLDHLGLVSALRQQVESIGEKNGLKVSFASAEIHKRLSPEVESVLYRIVQEALTNIVRHANASEIDVIMMVREGKLVIVIEDNGNGFNPEEIQQGERLGVLSMRERADMLGGKLIIESAPGKGTTVSVEVDYDDSNLDR